LPATPRPDLAKSKKNTGKTQESRRMHSSMQRYFLAKHAFVCAVGTDVIVLDLKRDKYFAFERDFWEPIVRCIGGWPEEAVPCDDTAPDSTALAQLMANGLLTDNGQEGKDATPAAVAMASSSLIEDFQIQPPAVRAGHVCVFVGAIVAALLRLRFQPIERVIAGVLDRRSTRSVQASDIATLRDLTEIFRRLRPLLFSSRDHCLFESLALLNFLSHYGIQPTWVFGVTAAPFSAHCWLQAGQVACNDPLDQIRRYTPIMVV
jgi:hypothetical protein